MIRCNLNYQEEPPQVSKMKFSILLNKVPTSISAVVPVRKYNKDFIVSWEWDDGVMRMNNPILSFLNNLFFTDGCGNNKAYRFGIAINSGTGIPGDEGYNKNFIQAPEFRYFTDNLKWDIEDHGFAHGPNPTALIDLIKLYDQILLRVKYKMRFTVVPNSDLGYTHASYISGFVGSTSHGDDPADEFQSVRIHHTYDPVTGIPVFYFFTREDTDEWQDPTEVERLNLDVSTLGTTRNIFRGFTHSTFDTEAKSNGFKQFMNHIHDTVQDRALVVSMREALEYTEMASLPITYTLVGNKYNVEIDISALSDKNRWRDLSFILTSDATITGIQAGDGVTSSTFNPATGLVNISSERTVWNN